MLFDKKGAGTIPQDSLGDVLRALGQNPTQKDVAELAQRAGKDSQSSGILSCCVVTHPPRCAVDYNTFLQILHRPDGFESAGTAGTSPCAGATTPLIVEFVVQRNSSRDSRYSTRRATDSSDRGSCVTSSPRSGRS